jgi:RTX calcium-binding nonapeptide repeat (4 copies)
MRRTVLLMVSIALGALFVSGVALAVTKKCSASPCYGTKKDDTLTERRGVKDEISGLRGDDTIRAGLVVGENLQERHPRLGPDSDILHGKGRSDRLNSGDLEGRDVLYGGKGHDVCLIDPGDRTHGCEKVKRVSVIVD